MTDETWKKAKIKLRCSDFVTKYKYEGKDIRMMNLPKYSFNIHARAALALARLKHKIVKWQHEGVDISTANGHTLQELQEWYKNYQES
jgi:hypothetical protein